MIITKTFRQRLKPNRNSRVSFSKASGCSRWIFNFGLAEKIKAYEEEKRVLSYFDLNNLLPALRKAKETLWLSEVHSQILQQSLRDLDLAFAHFFRRVSDKKTPGYPKFKKKGVKESFRYPQGVKITDHKVYLPKVGWVRFKKTREIEGTVKQTTVIQEAGKWYVCFTCQIDVEDKVVDIREETVVGIDVGITKFATLATGSTNQIIEIENPQFLEKELSKYQFLCKNLSKKKLRGKNRLKARYKLQSHMAKLKNKRKDFAHKLSTDIVKNHDIVGIEGLSIQSLLEKSKKSLSRKIADAGWRQFLGFLKYKLAHSRKVLVEASQFFASTKTCCKCNKVKTMKLSDRTYCCKCGNKIGRDINAAINIKNIAVVYYKAVGTTV